MAETSILQVHQQQGATAAAGSAWPRLPASSLLRRAERLDAEALLASTRWWPLPKTAS
jgi:hypothetical protein